VQETPEKRRALCCGEKPGIVFVSACERALTAALRAGVIVLDAPAVERCVAAVDRAYAGCEWPGHQSPPLPDECQGAIQGKLTQSQPCRSSLECAADLRCHGSGPNRGGECGPAKEAGEKCGPATDALASYARQDSWEESHPECKGYCARNQCAPLIALGGACDNHASCGKGRHCIAKKCSDAALPRAGEPCAEGVCDKGYVCLANKCAARKRAGEKCTHDWECLGGCILAPDAGPRTDGGASGVCGRMCGVR
jgi:hypothetical protein